MAASSRSTPWAKPLSTKIAVPGNTFAKTSCSDDQAAIQTVDHRRHALEPVGDDAQAILAKVLGLDAERVRQALHDLLGVHRAVAVNEVVQIARRQARSGGEAAIREACLPHQPLDGMAEGLLAVLPPTRHHRTRTRFAASKR